jgi:hypothetical protein
MMERKNIDRLFQEKFKDFEVNPPKEAWNAIEAELNKKEKKRIIPLWWKFSGVAALLVISALIYSTFTDGNFDVKPDFNPNSEGVVFENQEQEVAEKDSIGLEINNPVIDKETEKSLTPIANPIRNNQIVTSVDENFTPKSTTGSTKRTESNRALNSKNEKENRSNTAQSEMNSNYESVVKTVEKDKGANKNLLPNNGINNDPSNDIPTTIQAETGIASRENQSKFDLNKYKTAEEINKIKGKDSAIATAIVEAGVEPNALEELLKEKEKEEKSTEPKINRWLVTSAVAPVYFNSVSNGSPIDSQFENNTKDYESNLTFGLGVQYALSKKLMVRSGLNQVTMGYNTNEIVYFASLGKPEMDNVNISNEGAAIVVMSKNSSGPSFIPDAESNILGTNEGVLNQQMGYLEMPLEVSYKILDKKFGIQFIGGISTLFLTENQVIVRSSDFEFDLGEANNLNQVHFSSNIGIGFNYTFLKSFQANFEPILKYQLNTFSNDAGNFKPYFIGLYSGISYRF